MPYLLQNVLLAVLPNNHTGCVVSSEHKSGQELVYSSLDTCGG